MCRYAGLIDDVFRRDDSAAFTTPGHPEIELALVRLYRCTGEKRWLDLSRFFIDKRGNNEKDRGEASGFASEDYLQDRIPCVTRAKRSVTASEPAISTARWLISPTSATTKNCSRRRTEYSKI